jgi:hydroxymethylpyrimidine pyrophosphatase-like HAD family hydrolase
MSKYELIAFDMDGTLLDSEKRIRKDSLEMIDKAVKSKKTVSLSTGRCIPELRAYRKQLSGVRYIIGLSGALVFDAKSNKEIYSRLLSPDTVCQIIREIKGFDVMIHPELPEKLYLQIAF